METGQKIFIAGIIMGFCVGVGFGAFAFTPGSQETLDAINRTWNIGFQDGVVCGDTYRPENVTLEDCLIILHRKGEFSEY